MEDNSTKTAHDEAKEIVGWYKYVRGRYLWISWSIKTSN